jgi:hypothetical protein
MDAELNSRHNSLFYKEDPPACHVYNHIDRFSLANMKQISWVFLIIRNSIDVEDATTMAKGRKVDGLLVS